jgi:MFS family permease
MWPWIKQSLLGDDLFLRVIFASFGLAVTIGVGFILKSLLTDQRPDSAAFAVFAALFLGAFYLGFGVLPLVAAFSSQKSRPWRWATKVGDGISGFDELVLFLILVVVAVMPLVIITLLLRVFGAKGQRWEPKPVVDSAGGRRGRVRGKRRLRR